MSAHDQHPSPPSTVRPQPSVPVPDKGSGGALFLALALVGVALVGLSVLPTDPVVGAFSLTLGFAILTAAVLVGLMNRVRRAGRPFTVRPTTTAGWAGGALMVLGWLMVVVLSVPWLDTASLNGPVITALTAILVAGYACMVLGGLVAGAAAWWGTERSRPLIVLAVLHLVWPTYVAIAVPS